MCEVCSKEFDYVQTLAKHRQVVHQNKFRYQCNVCGRMFFDKGHYDGHINTHTNTKPFECKTCGKSYTFESSLRRHVQSCLAEPDKFKCNLCEKAFASKVGLQDHTKGMHGTKDMNKVCLCGKEFSWRSSFARHQSTCRILQWHQIQ